MSVAPNIDWLVGTGAISLLDNWVGNDLLSTNAFDNPNTFVTGHPREHWTSSATASFTAYGPPNNPGSFEYALANNQIPKGTTYVLYDNENWSLTPTAEQQDPELYMTEFVQLASDYGYKAILAPAIDLTNSMPCYRPNDTDWGNYLNDCDIPGLVAEAGPAIYEVQAQRFESNASANANCGCYEWFVDEATYLATWDSPNLSVFAGISSNHSGVLATGTQLANDVLNTQDVLNGFWLNIPVQSVACPSCALTGDPGSAADMLWDLGYVGVGYQTIAPVPATPGTVGGSEQLSATGGGSGTAIRYSVDPSSAPPGACAVTSAGAVTFTLAGTCVVDDNESGSTNYLAAPQVSQTIPVSPAPQAITFVPPAADVVGDSAALSATGGPSGSPVVFNVDPSSSPGACALSGAATMTYTGAGSCIIDANQAASANYLAAPQVTGTVQVGPTSQTIKFTAPSTAANGTSLMLSATGGRSGNPVTFSLDPSSGPGVCNVSGTNGSLVSFTAVGSCVIDANQAQGGRSYLAAPPVVQTISVMPGSQTISFVPPSSGAVGSGAPLVATGGSSTEPIVFSVDSSSGPGVCEVSGPDGDLVQYTGAGSCVIDATQGGDANYLAATPVTGTIPIGQGSQAIAFSAPAGATYGGSDQLVATGGASGNPVDFSLDPGSDPVCSLSDTVNPTVTYTGIGNCIVDLGQAGNANYRAAPTVVATIAVGGTAQAIDFTPPASGVFGGSTVLSATGGVTGNPVVFAVDPAASGVCVLGSDGITLDFTGVGNCVVDASEAGAGTVAAGESTATIVVSPAAQTVTAQAPPDGQVGDSYPLAGSGGGSGNPVLFTVDAGSDPGVCNVSGPAGGQSVDYLAAGSCLLDAEQAASADYQAAAVTLGAASVSPGAQQISLVQPEPGIVGSDGTLLATSGASGIPITFSVDASSDPGACSISPAAGSIVVYTGVGNCVIDANEPGDADYLPAAQVSETISVGPGEQDLTVSAPQTAPAGTSTALSATGGLSSSAIVFSIDPTSGAGVCTLGGPQGSIVTFAAVGSCVVDADKAGDTNYEAASTVVTTITVTPGSQTISFVPPAAGTVGGSDVLTGTDVGGGTQPIVFSIDPSSAPGACTIADGDGAFLLSYTGVGQCVVDADQAADANFAAATTVVADVPVGPGSQAISFNPLLTGQVAGSETLTASSSSASGVPIVFTVDPSTAAGVCNVSGAAGATLSFTGTGTCVVDSNEAGDANYDPAPTATASISVTPGPQSIAFAAPASGVPGTTAVLSATSSSSSGIPIVFSLDPSTAAGVCSLSGPDGDLVTYAGVGQCIVDADEAGNGNYTAAATVTETIAVALGAQQITFAPPVGAVVGGSATLVATGGPTGNPIVFSLDPSTAAGICSLSGPNGAAVTYLAAGSCVIDANQSGNGDYLAATATATIAVDPAPQVISFPTPPAVIGVVETLVATTNANNPVVFSLDPASGAGVCSLSGVGNATVSYTAIGSCVVDANAAGTANYLPAPQVTVTIHVKTGSQFISFPPPVSAGVGTSTTLAATTSGGSGNPIVYSVDWSSDPGVCAVSGPNGSKLSFLSVGICVIDANQAGNTYYKAAGEMWAVIEVGPGPQTITYTTQPQSPQYGGTYQPAATGGGSGNPVVFSTSTPAVCTYSFGTVFFVGVGKCTIDANEDGDVDYQSAPQTVQSFTVAKVTQTVTFTSTAPAGANYGGNYQVTVTGGASGNAVILTSSTLPVCTISNLFTVNFVGVGTCTLNATQSGTSHYAPGSASQSFTVGPASQKIAVTTTPGVYRGSETVAVVQGASGNPVVLSIDSSTAAGVCSMAAGTSATIDFTGVGSCVVDANEAGNAYYSAAPQVQVTIAVGPAAQSITFSIPSTSVYGDAAALAASATSGLPVTFSVDARSGAGVCSLAAGSPGQLQFTGVGTCLVDANQPGTPDYSAAPQVQQAVVVAKAAQAISFTAPKAAVYGQTVTVTATGGGSGNPVVFSISTASGAGVCTVTGAVVSFTGAGNCIVIANEAGNADYSSAPVVRQTIAVAKAPQTVTISSAAPSHPTYHGPNYTITATGTGSGKPVVFSSESKTICTVTGATVSFVGVGTCTLLAIEPGTADYTGASATQKFTVYKAAQTVTFTSSPPVNAVAGQQYTVAASGSGSGLAITFTSLSATVCSVSGSTVSLLAAGTCVVEAHEAGNADYNPATATQKFKVGKAAPAGGWWHLALSTLLTTLSTFGALRALR